MPVHHGMRVVDRDLIRGGHYGQRSMAKSERYKESVARSEPALSNALRRPESGACATFFTMPHPTWGAYAHPF